MKIRKHLSADGLFQMIKKGFRKIKDHRPSNIEISLVDTLMSAFAMFSLKDPSLLAFDKRREEPKNLKKVYGIDRIPSDTQMRTILDEVNPEEIRPLFKRVFQQLQRGKVLEKMRYMGGYYLASLDGTGYFKSEKVHCANCLEKQYKKSGKTIYSHQILGGAIVHPDRREVIPFAPEPIIKQDGTEKNDCERNAAKRFLTKLRQDHPRLPLIILEDALSGNAPHIRELKRHDLRFIIGVKPGDHAHLFDFVAQANEAGETTWFEIEKEGTLHRFCFLNDAPLNQSNSDVRVNFLEYWEIKPNKTRHFSWITDLIITTTNVFEVMRGGRARWKIENETFNTLKNQGYHFEHNFGHGHQHLSVVFVFLMMLAFAVDQAQQLSCQLFQAAWDKAGSKRALWEKMRGLFHDLPIESMSMIWRAIAFGFRVEQVIIYDTS